MSKGRAIVVGGGAIGTSCAYYLAKDQWDVTILEQDQQGMGSTSGNCGLLSYSHVLPLTTPDALMYGLKAFGRKNTPLSISPRLDLSLWLWLLRFALNCNEASMLKSARGRAELIDSSRAMYPGVQQDAALSCDWQDEGCMFIFKSQKGMDHYAETHRIFEEQFDIPAQRYEAKELESYEPALLPGVAAGAWHYPQDSHAQPAVMMRSWREALEKLGVEIVENTQVTGIESGSGGASTVRSGTKEWSGDVVVIATGAWTPKLNKILGCKVPIQPGKGYSITMPRPPKCPKLPLMFVEDKVVVTPWSSSYRIGSTMEFSGYNTSIRPSHIDRLTNCASHYMEIPDKEPVEEPWYGWRPMTHDGLPVIDRTPDMENVFVAAGHGMLGLTMAPATGKLIMEMISGTAPHIDPAPYSITRF